jgi:hypothetical protein
MEIQKIALFLLYAFASMLISCFEEAFRSLLRPASLSGFAKPDF